MTKINLANNMRELRSSNEYSQQYVSERIHVARQTYSLYESGKRFPDLKTVCNLAELYNVPVDALIHGDFLGRQISEPLPETHAALLPGDSLIPLNGSEAKMLMDYKALSAETQKEVREFIRFKKRREGNHKNNASGAAANRG